MSARAIPLARDLDPYKLGRGAGRSGLGGAGSPTGHGAGGPA